MSAVSQSMNQGYLENNMTDYAEPRYEPVELDGLFSRAKQVLGIEKMQTLLVEPRGNAFSVLMDKAIQTVGTPDQVTDEQILEAYKTALSECPLD